MRERGGPRLDGATQTVIPTRVPCAPHNSLLDIGQELRAQDAAVTECELTSLGEIRHTVGKAGLAACEFQTVLVVSTNDSDTYQPFEFSRTAAWSRLSSAVKLGEDY